VVEYKEKRRKEEEKEEMPITLDGYFIKNKIAES
jgi:hypothetical protein